HVGVNRAEYDASSPPGPAFLPEQRLSLEVALAAYTSGSARLNQQADQPGATGVIAPGALADLVVLDRDPFTAPDDEIAAATVTSTWIDGLPVYQR
ncbi:MAG TPA: amidohydrolase family protein, partial [Marmoricola sp.]|nr:amidohydrolase family protein [Marmoricola sp.]